MEIWDIFNKSREKTGKTIQRGQLLTEGEFHLVVHIWIQNSKDEFLIQKRSDNLAWMPGIWATTGGSAVAGEDSLTAILRETQEELGIALEAKELQLLFTQIRSNDITDIWLIRMDLPISTVKFTLDDMSAIRWETKDYIQKMIEIKNFVDYGKDYFNHLGIKY